MDEARLNYRLYAEIKTQPDYLGWAATILFYTALHLVQAYFVEVAPNGFYIPRGHQKRDEYVRQKLKQIWAPYLYLQNLSNAARYHPLEPKPTLSDLEKCEKAQFAQIVHELGKLGINL